MTTITKPYDFASGTLAVASEVNANFDAVINSLNGKSELTETNIFLASQSFSAGLSATTGSFSGDLTCGKGVSLAATVSSFTNGQYWFADNTLKGRVDGVTLPYAPAPANWVGGPPPVYTSAASITLAAGTMAVDDTRAKIIERKASLVVSLASSGAGGLDTGTEANNTWYYVWLCEGTSGVTAVFSASSTSPTLPTGYTSFKRLLPFAVRNDASSNLIPFGNIIGWTGGQPFVPWDVARTFYQDGTGYTGGTARVIAAGTATSWTDVSCAAFVPPISRRAGIRLAKDGTTYNGFRPNGATHTGIGSHTVNGNDLFDVDLDASQIFEYIRWPAGGGNIHADVTGFYVTEV
jgi:hypothetical protein